MPQDASITPYDAYVCVCMRFINEQKPMNIIRKSVKKISANRLENSHISIEIHTNIHPCFERPLQWESFDFHCINNNSDIFRPRKVYTMVK